MAVGPAVQPSARWTWSSVQVAGLALAPLLFDAEYLTVEHAEIYVVQSRHWVVAWLWFLS